MNGAVLSKSGYRYQDLCAFYFFLNHFVENENDLDFLICENNKLDFEIWFCSQLKGYQAKSSNNFTARDLNALLKFFLDRIKSESRQAFLCLVLGSEPEKSLQHLISKLRGDRGVKRYHKRTEDYIATVLDNIDLSKFEFQYFYIAKQQVYDLLHGLSGRVLQKFFNESEDLPPGLIENFIGRLKDAIDAVSTKTSITDRKITKKQLKILIKKVVSSSGYYKDTKSGSKFVTVKIPDDYKKLKIEVEKTAIPEKPSLR